MTCGTVFKSSIGAVAQQLVQGARFITAFRHHLPLSPVQTSSHMRSHPRPRHLLVSVPIHRRLRPLYQHPIVAQKSQCHSKSSPAVHLRGLLRLDHVSKSNNDGKNQNCLYLHCDAVSFCRWNVLKS